MATLIAHYANGRCIGRCDAKCYEAVNPVCDCICGGLNHGAGLKKAIGNTEALTQEMAENLTGNAWPETPPVQTLLFD